MCNIETSIVIDADIHTVWALLSDLPSYTKWNSFFKRITGPLAMGETLHVMISPPGSKSSSFSPTVIALKENSEIRWRGKLFFNWFFCGEHYLLLEALSEGTTKFIHGEKFSGFLVPLFKKLQLEKTKAGFEIFNRELKHAAEVGI